jgi:hypothetical protein
MAQPSTITQRHGSTKVVGRERRGPGDLEAAAIRGGIFRREGSVDTTISKPDNEVDEIRCICLIPKDLLLTLNRICGILELSERSTAEYLRSAARSDLIPKAELPTSSQRRAEVQRQTTKPRPLEEHGLIRRDTASSTTPFVCLDAGIMQGEFTR